nr:MAG TPA: hypothetical protein [Caudoviricetes sp.]
MSDRIKKYISSSNELFKLLDHDIPDGDEVTFSYSWTQHIFRTKYTSPINMMPIFVPLCEVKDPTTIVDNLDGAESIQFVIARLYEAVLSYGKASVEHNGITYEITEGIRNDIFYQMEDSIIRSCRLTKKYCGDSYGIPAMTEEELRDIIGYGGMPCEGESSDRIAWGNIKGAESHEEANP